mmetsp:Transcript_63714/g.170718  ORF Transcript_63714/g.170718 Transcript_63714/m.170718 type:complete len:140 (-) Transcript_63714:240-659(-)
MHNEAQRPEITTIVRAIAKETVTAVRGIIAFNKKHRITSKTRAAASNAVGKVRIHPLARVFQSFNRPPLSSQAVAFEREHRVREKMSTAARGAYDQVRSVNEKHRLVARTREAAAGAFAKAGQINERYQVSPPSPFVLS